MTGEIYGSDAYAPAEVARRVETVGVAKAHMALLPLAILGVLAGAFVGLGSLLSVIVRSDPGLGFAAAQLGAGVAFSLGLLLVVVAGAELFTGNNLLVMAWADGRITTAQVLRNWKAVAVVFPITAFVAAGFEHSIANMYLLPLAMLVQSAGGGTGGQELVTLAGMGGNLVPVLAGNLLGGSVLVGLTYHAIYRRGTRAVAARDATRAAAAAGRSTD